MSPSGRDPVPTQRRRLEALLTEDRARTVARIASLGRDIERIDAATADEATDDEHDPEGATIAFERQQHAALLAQAREHLTAIDHAARRLRQRQPLRCADCDRPLPLERLLARPTATRCVTCAAARS